MLEKQSSKVAGNGVIDINHYDGASDVVHCYHLQLGPAEQDRVTGGPKIDINHREWLVWGERIQKLAGHTLRQICQNAMGAGCNPVDDALSHLWPEEPELEAM